MLHKTYWLNATMSNTRICDSFECKTLSRSIHVPMYYVLWQCDDGPDHMDSKETACAPETQIGRVLVHSRRVKPRCGIRGCHGRHGLVLPQAKIIQPTR